VQALLSKRWNRTRYSPVREEWETNVKPDLHRNAIRQVERVEKAADVLFAEVDDTIREAARIALGRKLTPESIRGFCRYGWNQLFSCALFRTRAGHKLYRLLSNSYHRVKTPIMCPSIV
jgi:hypothetical protein